MRTLTLLVFGLCSIGCEDTQHACETAALTAMLDPLPTYLSADAVVTGELTRPASMVVNQLFVNGVSAMSTAANYDKFMVAVPLAKLVATRADKTGQLALQLFAQTDCETAEVEVLAASPSVVTVVVPPKIEPAALTLLGGASVAVAVTFDGKVEPPTLTDGTLPRLCIARGDRDFQATVGAVDLFTTPEAPNAQGKLSIGLSTSATSKKGASAQISCSDEAGNKVVATFTVPD